MIIVVVFEPLLTLEIGIFIRMIMLAAAAMAVVMVAGSMTFQTHAQAHRPIGIVMMAPHQHRKPYQHNECH